MYQDFGVALALPLKQKLAPVTVRLDLIDGPALFP